MVQSYKEAVDWFQSRQVLGIKPGLERMEWLLEKCNHPERRLKAVHIAGTNGKGSTLIYLRNILQEAGYVVGSFTSPAIARVNDQISVNGIPIDEIAFTRLVKEIKPLVEEAQQTEHGSPSEFEVLTLMAILHFAREAYPDVVLIEAGMGGRNDSTNIIHPLLSIITNVSYDHMNMLGETIEEISAEKAGIIKPGVPVITGAEKKDALEVIKQTATESRSKVYEYNRNFGSFHHTFDEEKEVFSFQSSFTVLEDVIIHMPGSHQVKNAALAIMAAEFLKKYYSFLIDEEQIRDGLKAARHPGRFERISDNPLIFLDGAHNEAAVESLVDTLRTRLANKKVHVLFAALSTKDVKKMTTLLESVAACITYTSFDHPYAHKSKDLYDQADKIIPSDYFEDWEKAVDSVKGSLKKGEILVITGSLYFLSRIRGSF